MELTTESPGYAGSTPLHWGCIGGHDEIVRSILKHAKSIDSDAFPEYINHGNNAGLTPLMEAAGRNYIAVVKILLSFGANYVTGLIGRELSSGTALHDACFKGSREVVMHLLEVASQIWMKSGSHNSLMPVMAKAKLHCTIARPRGDRT